MANGMTRSTWGRIEYLAIMLAGGFGGWEWCSSNQRSAYREVAAELLTALEDGESCADRVEKLRVSKYEEVTE